MTLAAKVESLQASVDALSVKLDIHTGEDLTPLTTALATIQADLDSVKSQVTPAGE